MTGEETKQIKEKYLGKIRETYDPDMEVFKYESLWNWILSEIITPYEKQLEQVEREKGKALKKIAKEAHTCFGEVVAGAWGIDLQTRAWTDEQRTLFNKHSFDVRDKFLDFVKSQNTQTK